MRANAEHYSFDVMGLLTRHNTRWNLSEYKENQIVYAQGDPAELGPLRPYRPSQG